MSGISNVEVVNRWWKWLSTAEQMSWSESHKDADCLILQPQSCIWRNMSVHLDYQRTQCCRPKCIRCTGWSSVQSGWHFCQLRCHRGTARRRSVNSICCNENCDFKSLTFLRLTRAVQPVATCRQSPYLHKPAIAIVTSFSIWRLAPTALVAPVLIMMSFSLWRHSLLSWPRPPLYGRTDTLPRLIYKDNSANFRHFVEAPSVISFKNRLDDFLADMDNWKADACKVHHQRVTSNK